MSEAVVETTSQPLSFPDPREEMRTRGAAFQQLSPDARFREIFAMMAYGLNMTRRSPRRAQIEKQWLDEENAMREFYREVFAKHGK